MSIEEQRRTMVLTRVVAGSLSMTEATTLRDHRRPRGDLGRRYGRTP